MLPAQLHRRFRLLSGTPRSCRREAAACWHPGGIWVGNRAPDNLPATQPAKLLHQLGTETDLLVFDATEGFDVEAFAVALGLVRGGGLFVLLTPPLDDWPRLPDRTLEHLSVAGWPAAKESRFLLRFASLLKDFHPSDPPLPATAGKGFALTPEQEQALSLVQRVARGHPRRPLLLTADRGRGKSTLLGMAAARLMRQRPTQILVTAPRCAAAAQLFHHARRELPDAHADASGLSWGTSRLRFMAPDALLEEKPEADLLLVDEAAGIPLPLLQRLLLRHNRVVLASTVHGYEGSGQGFSLRLGQFLDAHRPGWRHFSLQDPVRWAPDDPLEAFGHRALLLNAEIVPLESSGFSLPSLRLRRLPRDELLRDELLLIRIIGLMVSAHYRTTPWDTRYLLDAPNLELFLAEDEGKPLAVALVAQEGELSEPLRTAILRGGRRPRGHLLPQLLATRCALPQALESRCWRLVRIAVHPDLQRRGIGSRLLRFVCEEARRQGVQLIGTSFGATPSLVRFWRKAGFRPLRLGYRREASSGAHAVLMARALDAGTASWLASGQARFQRDFPLQLAQPFRELDPVLALLLRDPVRSGASLPPEDRERLIAYAHGRLTYLDALGALHQLARTLADPDDPRHQLLMRKVLQGRDWRRVVADGGFTGKREAEQALRESVLDLING